MTTYIFANTKAKKLSEVRAQRERLEAEVVKLHSLESQLQLGYRASDFQYDPDCGDFDVFCANTGCRRIPKKAVHGSVIFLSDLPLGEDALCEQCKMTPEEQAAMEAEKERRAVRNATDSIRTYLQQFVEGVVDVIIEAAEDPSKDPIEILKKKAASKS